MSYSPPAGDSVAINFTDSYTPPIGSAVAIEFATAPIGAFVPNVHSGIAIGGGTL